MNPLPHLVFDRSWAEGYERGGWIVTEIRSGTWKVVNPNEKRSEALKTKAKR